ncbi:MAG: transposase [Planctomycetes bacterium]|nr:transposase [Planctomycetota bacterium]
MENESVIVQDIQIHPHNIRFERQVYYSAAQNKYFRGPLPGGYDQGDFGADLRALILSLKYCGNMSEPKIREFLENFDVQISAGSISNTLTKTADAFAGEFDAIVQAGLASTRYQQTDDTSARVDGQFWHTHILCNPFYAAYFTRPHKDRLTVLEILQNTDNLQFEFGKETLELLQAEFHIPNKWQGKLEEVGNTPFDRESLATLLDGWFDDGNQQLRTAIEQASAIVYSRHQTFVPVIETIVCDGAGQFKLLTKKLALCCPVSGKVDAGRHYEKLSPIASRHKNRLDSFLERYWDYYQSLQRYRDGPTNELAKKVTKGIRRTLFDTDGLRCARCAHCENGGEERRTANRTFRSGSSAAQQHRGASGPRERASS